MPPFYVRTVYDYGLWFERLLSHTGGHIEPGPHLLVGSLVDMENEEIGLTIPRQRLVLGDGTFLSFQVALDAEFNPIEYSFHFQVESGPMIWRKDFHEGHERELGCLEHIHPNPADEDYREVFEVVEIDEVLGQVADHRPG